MHQVALTICGEGHALSVLLCARKKSISLEEWNIRKGWKLGKMDVLTLKSMLTPEMKNHREVQWHLKMIGNQLGYNAVEEYEVFNLVSGRFRSKIDVVWLSGDRIAVAFEVRRKTRNLDVPTSEKDKNKLARLNADERFLVNFSTITGKVYIFKMGENGEWL